MNKNKHKRTTLRRLASKAWAFYQSRVLTGDKGDYEPAWVHPSYQQVKDWLDDPTRFQGEDLEEVENLITSLGDHRVRSQDFIGMGRLIHEGWKIGTPSWVFMGRSLGHVEACNGDLVLCCRGIPPHLRRYFRPIDNCWDAWIAYSKTDPMGATSFTANCYGPCLSRDELLQVITSTH